ncbi:hypothetical protein [Vibrio tasmaniensis]|uniref:hypothetical protein n=1 Tax=Vibrio tasmaniensis TaxID=212663 RepID=UPI00107F33EB|nr:hypothetical protein [Vibrio tasmaniensis]
MAITIRNTEEHEQMLLEVKELTNINTMSKALIKSGYLAIDYHNKYKKSAAENEKLRRELYQLKNKISNYVTALDDLRAS